MATLTLSEAKSYYFEASKKVSDIVRQLGLAAVGLVWVFKNASGNSISLDPKLEKAILWVVLALGCDFMQYLVTSYVWFAYFRVKESKNPDLDQEFLAPTYINWPNFVFFFLKSAALLIAYCCFIIPYLWWRIHS